MDIPGTDTAGTRDPRDAFAELSSIVLGAQPLTATLARVADLAMRTIPGATATSVTLIENGRVTSAAFTGPIAAELDERQYDAGFGPCMDAALSASVVTIEDTADSAAYPDFARLAAHHGVTHSLSIGLPVEHRSVGSLNVYGTGDGRFDSDTEDLATAFAACAGVAVANAGLYASTANLARNLQVALESRAVIDQAKGILMARHHLTAEVAFELLSRRSNAGNRKLREVAREIVDEVERGGGE